jgi:hypothetical protein
MAPAAGAGGRGGGRLGVSICVLFVVNLQQKFVHAPNMHAPLP